MSALKEWHEKDFNEFLKEKKSGIIDFRADWCHACKLTEPIIAKVAQGYPELEFSKIDVSKNPNLASRMGVMSLPNIIIINNGKVVDQIIGATNADTLEKTIKKLKK